MTTELLDHPDRITLGFHAETAQEALALAKEWAHNEPHLKIKTVCSVRPVGVNEGRWRVELAVRWTA